MKFPFEPTIERTEPEDRHGRIRRMNVVSALECLATQSLVVEDIADSTVIIPPGARSLARHLGVTAPALYSSTGFGRNIAQTMQG